MKAHIYTFYWTVKTEVQELIEVSKNTDIQAAFNKSRVMSVQHEMLQELIRNMFKRLLLNHKDGYKLFEYAYSEGGTENIQAKAFDDYVKSATANKEIRHIFVSPYSLIGRRNKMTMPACMFNEYKSKHPKLFQKVPDVTDETVLSVAYDLDSQVSVDTALYVPLLEKAFRQSKANLKRSRKMISVHKKQRKKGVKEKSVGFTAEAKIKGAQQNAKKHAHNATLLKSKVEEIAKHWALSRDITWVDIVRRLNKEKFAFPNSVFSEWKESSLRSRASRGNIPKIKELKALAKDS